MSDKCSGGGIFSSLVQTKFRIYAKLQENTPYDGFKRGRVGIPVSDRPRTSPAYLADDCQLAADASARRLRSADTAKCVVRCTYNNFGDRCFAAAGPRLWNTLPLNLRLCVALDNSSGR